MGKRALKLMFLFILVLVFSSCAPKAGETAFPIPCVDLPVTQMKCGDVLVNIQMEPSKVAPGDIAECRLEFARSEKEEADLGVDLQIYVNLEWLERNPRGGGSIYAANEKVEIKGGETTIKKTIEIATSSKASGVYPFRVVVSTRKMSSPEVFYSKCGVGNLEILRKK